MKKLLLIITSLALSINLYAIDVESLFNLSNNGDIVYYKSDDINNNDYTQAENLKQNLDNCIRLPMSDNVRALNLSNTVAIMIYEALRQQNYPNLYWDEPHKSKMEIEHYET